MKLFYAYYSSPHTYLCIGHLFKNDYLICSMNYLVYSVIIYLTIIDILSFIALNKIRLMHAMESMN